MIEDLTGRSVHPYIASDIADEMDLPKSPVKYPYVRVAEQRARKRARAKKERRARKTLTNEQRLTALKIKLQAGDPNDPTYEKRLATAKKTVALATSLPVIARQKWANPEFQKEMEEKGHNYNPARYRGWMPFDVAQRVQREVIGARSRGEYEFFVKLYDLRFLPCRPDAVYDEWVGWTEFLGTSNTFGSRIITDVKHEDYRPFYEALIFARSLKLKTRKAWREACKAGEVPMDIPLDPHHVYNDAFVSWEHWLGLNTALDKITGKVVVPDLWVLYRDGRTDAFWWAKMSDDKYDAFSKTDQISIARTYVFEGELSKQVWTILDSYSEPYEDDQRERYIDDPTKFEQVRSELDSILKWSNT